MVVLHIAVPDKEGYQIRRGCEGGWIVSSQLKWGYCITYILGKRLYQVNQKGRVVSHVFKGRRFYQVF